MAETEQDQIFKEEADFINKAGYGALRFVRKMKNLGMISDRYFGRLQHQPVRHIATYALIASMLYARLKKTVSIRWASDPLDSWVPFQDEDINVICTTSAREFEIFSRSLDSMIKEKTDEVEAVSEKATENAVRAFPFKVRVITLKRKDWKGVMILYQEEHASDGLLIPALLPVCFPELFKEKPVTEKEKKAILEFQKFHNLDSQNDIKITNIIKPVIEAFSEQIGFEFMVNKTTIEQMVTREDKEELYRLNMEYQQVVDSIEQAEDTLRRRISDRNSIARRIADYEARKPDRSKAIEELTDFFDTHEEVQIIHCADSELYFAVQTQFEYFDPEIYESAKSRENSWANERFGLLEEKLDLRKRLLDAVFLDRSVKINTMSVFNFSKGEVVYALDRGKSAWSQLLNPTIFPNPHIYFYGCMGEYQQVVDDCLVKGDIISALEQCIASAKSLNFADSVVMGRFMDNISEYIVNNSPIFLTSDGRLCGAKEAVETLEQEGNDNE